MQADNAALTHGRHCSCSACAREDWTKIVAPCGMHGPSCPAIYAPVAASGHGTDCSCMTCEGFRQACEDTKSTSPRSGVIEAQIGSTTPKEREEQSAAFGHDSRATGPLAGTGAGRTARKADTGAVFHPASRPTNLDGWSVSLCPGCGATVGEWLTEDGPDVVEYQECPMCVEAVAEEAWWF